MYKRVDLLKHFECGGLLEVRQRGGPGRRGRQPQQAQHAVDAAVLGNGGENCKRLQTQK